MLNQLRNLCHRIDSHSLLKSLVRYDQTQVVTLGEASYPVYVFVFGTADVKKPTLFITGGYHGLERIGAQLAWSLLKTTLDRLIWDKALQFVFENVRLVVVPLVNPIGYEKMTRCNGNGVDLMRNSPVQATIKTPFLLGGHRISKRLPWYQGEIGQLEKENQIVTGVFEKEVQSSSIAIALDFHSGFGLTDRLWFPYAYTADPFEKLAELMSFVRLFEQTHPYHIYKIEPQSHGYLLNGDMWDYYYLKYREQNPNGLFLPFTLEMGSWTWVRKNPLQLLNKFGAFNPIKEHRIKRTFRRHHLLFDFMLKALFSNVEWAVLSEHQKLELNSIGKKRWYF